MEPAGAVASLVCAVAIIALAPRAIRARRRGGPYADLPALCLAVGALALLGAFVAQIAGASRLDTGRFLIGMGAGVAVGLTLGCAVLLVVDWRGARTTPVPMGGNGGER